MSNEVCILVVEDEQSLRADLEDYLTAKGYQVYGASSLQEARQQLLNNRLDAVILDLGLPDGDGFQLLPQIRSQLPGCGTVILTAYGEPDSRIRALEEGADAYLVKRATLREIEATLRSVLRRLPQIAAELPVGGNCWILDKVNWTLSSPNGLSAALTSTEMSFLSALEESRGAPCTREELVRLLLRRVNSDEQRNLDAVVRRLRRKISLETGMDLPVKVVYGVGYAFPAPLRCLTGA
ncbi:response regulator transcription factor [Candidatus Magnetaquicoccus inordinatus]|uniref:response regulator transcription factor n=1 Tax=Candidatus Magnetaquicoccus inordinatus TaxID=2496818 RepID=UPI00102CAFEF|nr:response regulator transcription factor [Candidatus Magnetaquicoccus inordinatus]